MYDHNRMTQSEVRQTKYRHTWYYVTLYQAHDQNDNDCDTLCLHCCLLYTEIKIIAVH